MLQKHEKRQQELREKHGREGRELLARNAKQPGVVMTGSGLQYTILLQGTGPRPGPTSRVRLHYKGTLLDGTEFDSSGSLTGGTPALHHIGQGLRAMSEVLQLMPVGSKYRVTVPPQLGYGDLGLPGSVPPSATLTYEISLLEIVK
jgi:FKBP-type peptidyl-prolyl cis-trans isomerase